MKLFNPQLDDLVTRLYRTASTIDDTAIRELLRNAAVALLRAHDFETTEHCIELITSLLVTAAELHLLDFKLASLLREDVYRLADASSVEVVVAH